MSATLADVARAVGAPTGAGADTVITSITHDSRQVEPGSLFCCVPGARSDGHDFAPRAVAAGARALLVERVLALGVPQVQVSDVRRALGPAAAAVYGDPSRSLTVIGVTGTNGKSSTVQLLADIWAGAGRRAEVYGTLTSARTTPEAPDLQRRLRASADGGTCLVAMEVSSHALELGRVAGTRFAAAVFTNLGRDHLDFHGDVESYFRAKARLFDPAYTPLAVVNLDDAHGARLAAELAGTAGLTTLGYQLADAEDLTFDGPVSHWRWRGHPVTLPLAGRHNVANALAAATAAAALGIPEATVARGLAATRPVRGRFELVEAGQPFVVAVDYAHTPDALAAAIAAARLVARGRVLVVFGCGGDRDQAKRPEMGRVAAEAADRVFVTSDNPRSEDPQAIIDAIVAGVAHRGALSVEPDRHRAIARALGEAEPGDVVLLAGKGHETVQITGATEAPFDDRAVALELLEARA